LSYMHFLLLAFLLSGIYLQLSLPQFIIHQETYTTLIIF
jgi:hypothetical protein